MSGERLLIAAPIPSRHRQRRATTPAAPSEQLQLDFTAAEQVVQRCSSCDAELTAGDVRQARHLCERCRHRRALDLEAERDYLRAPRALHCSCRRWSFAVNGDGFERCGKCGKPPR